MTEDRLRRSFKRELRSRALLLVIAAVGAALCAPAGAMASPYADAVSASAPWGWWRLGETAGPSAAEARGLTTGTWTGGVTYGVRGALDGDDDAAATVGGSGSLNLGTTFAPAAGAVTLEAWARLTSTGTRYVLSDGTSSSRGFHLYTTGSGTPSFRVNTSTTSQTLTAPAMSRNAWHHLAGTFGAGVATVYVDGAVAATRNVSGTLRYAADPLVGGRFSTSSSSYWAGGLDELAVYDRALTAAEVAAHALAGRAATPATVAVDGPPARTDANAAAFALATADPQTTLSCSLDGAAASTCASAPSYPNLLDGAHVLRVTPTDRWGRTGTVATYAWTVDSTLAPDYDPAPPTTHIDAAMGTATQSTDAAFTLTADRSRVTFACSIDGAAFSACGATPVWHNVPTGPHTLRVRATDRFGQTETTPAAFSWTIDRVAPNTFAFVAGGAPGAAAVAVFSSTEAGGRFECRFGDGGWSACTPGLALPAGAAAISVRAIDAAGNADPAPATARLRADGASPEPTGASSFASAAVAMTFGASAGGAFTCRLDGGEWGACASPLALTGLSWGDHAWQARVDLAAGGRLEVPELRWTSAPPSARVAALQFPVLLHRSRDGRARARGRVPVVRFALNVASPVRVRVQRVRGRTARTLGAWTVAGRPGDVVGRVPDKLVRRLRRGRYRIAAQPASGQAARVAFAVV